MLKAEHRCLCYELKYSSCFTLQFPTSDIYALSCYFLLQDENFVRLPVLHSAMRKHEEQNQEHTGCAIFLVSPNFQVLHREEKKTSKFLTLLYYPTCMYLPSIRINVLCKGTVFSNLSLNFFLPERAIKDTSIYSVVEQWQLNFLQFSFLHTGNVPSFIMWNGMPHDFSKCTSNIHMSGNLGLNNRKALEKCIFADRVYLS